VLPVLPGVATFGVISGVAMIGSGMTPFTAMAMSVATYAGTAQLAALQLLAAGAPLVVIFFAALVLNLRFALYSLSMAPHFRSSTTPEVALLVPPFGQRLRALHHPLPTHPDESGKVASISARARGSGRSGRPPPPSGSQVEPASRPHGGSSSP
jgi:hypothetical protein